MREFPEVKKRLGFGMMRLPMVDNHVDIEQVKVMVDAFISNGFNYFDTAHGYIDGLSELAIKECLTSRYPREAYVLTDKLTDNFFNNEEDIDRVFQDELDACGVEYFDFYLMHALNRFNYPKFVKCKAFEHALKFKAEGRIKHLGFSFHDTADVLDQILTEHPEVEVVQIQYNYLDYDDMTMQSRLCYETVVKHGKRVIVMEPIRGGSLINLPAKPKELLEKSGHRPAELALRFAASPEHMLVVLSGMSNIDQMKDNISFMKDFVPINDEEFKLSQDIASLIGAENMIKCTACKYCVKGCPMNIQIPDLFGCLNSKQHFNNWMADYYYHNIATKDHGKACDCIKCGQCENICPQKLPIRDLLEEVSKEFDK